MAAQKGLSRISWVIGLLVCFLTFVLTASAFGVGGSGGQGDFKGKAAIDFHGDRWQHQPAKAKQAALWSAIIADLTPGDWPSLVTQLQLLVEQMNLTFDDVSDQFLTNEYNVWPYNFSTIRQKLIHSVGAVAMCKWVSKNNHNYTGLFQGANYGFVRFSWAKKPDPTAEYGYTPGIGLKFLRDYIPSTNFMSMYSLEGQSSANFFAHDLTNHVPDIGPDASFILREMRQAFLKASSWPSFLGLSDFAGFRENGDPVDNPSFPFRLIFHPTLQYHTMFPNVTSQALPSQLSQYLQPNTIAFYIYAQDSPYSNDVKQIGYLYLTSPTTSSQFSDKSMFLQHVRMEDDFEIRPDWINGAVSILEEQQSTNHWTFPDLPFNQ